MPSTPSKRSATLWLFVLVVALGLVIGAGTGFLAAHRQAKAERPAPPVKVFDARPSPSQLHDLVQHAVQSLPRPARAPAS